MSRTQVQLWYKRFREDREDFSDDARPGCLSTSTTDENIEIVKKMILYNHRITIREVADNIGISFGSCQAIFTDVFGTKCAAAKIVLKLHRNGHRSEDVDDVQRRSRFAQKKSLLLTNHGRMAMTLKPKQNIPMKASRRAFFSNSKKSKSTLKHD